MKIKMMMALGWLLTFGLTPNKVYAHELSSNQLIIKYKKGKNITKLFNKNSGIVDYELLNDELGLAVIEVAPSLVKLTQNQLENDPNILYIQKDYQLKSRSIPNDADWSKLWSFIPQRNNSDIKATLAWQYGTGGTDANGNEVVVAVVDGGIDINHEDLKNNLWVNKGEIAGTGRDDDGNGYVDDVHGFNSGSEDGNLFPDRHGTHVAGTIGAQGDNGVGVTGVNWRVKIMTVGLARYSTVEVVRGYTYVLKQKQIWLNSQGTKGANVVVTNSSFGIDKANCESGDFPLWNDIYNEMGKLGILSAAATINDNVNVDIEGDVPTGCSSPYLIKVTNTDNNNKKTRFAGYGINSINIGAPGTAIYSTLPNNNYGLMSGTSMATPHVAGLVALMHANASTKFNNDYLNDPAQAALSLRSILLQTADLMNDLKGKVSTGGKIDAKASVEAIYNY